MAAEQPLWLPVLSPTMTTRCTATIDCNEALRPDAYLKRDPAAMIAMSNLFSLHSAACLNQWVGCSQLVELPGGRDNIIDTP